MSGDPMLDTPLTALEAYEARLKGLCYRCGENKPPMDADTGFAQPLCEWCLKAVRRLEKDKRDKDPAVIADRVLKANARRRTRERPGR